MGKGRDKRRRKKKKIEKKTGGPKVFIKKAKPTEEKAESTVPVLTPTPSLESKRSL